jgi:DNA-binding SARP family transcriptional activator
MGLRINLFGEFSAQANGTPVEFLYKGRNGAILAYLLLRHDAPPKDGEVADLFWADYDDPDACLRSWCRRLRDAVMGLLDIKTIGGTVHLILKDTEVDVITYDTHLDKGEQDNHQALRQAVALFRRGPLLQGLDDLWVETAREARAARYLEALTTLAHHAAQTGQHAEARKYHAARVRHLLLALRERPNHEATWCDLLEALLLAGERIEANEIYRKCQDYFQRRQLTPPPGMTELYHRLQQASHQTTLESSLSTKENHADVTPLPVLGEGPEVRATRATEHSVQNAEFSDTRHPTPDTLPEGHEPLGGAVPLQSPFYIARPADSELILGIARRDSILCLRGPSQIGKTSLLARGLGYARQSGACVALTDFRKFSAEEIRTLESCYLALAQSLADQLELDTTPRDTWNPERAPGDNFERFLRREILRKTDTPLVWGLDEVDRLFHHTYKDDLFGRFRAWHNERALDPTGPWQRLTLILTYATEAYLLISDLNRSPFNVGTQVTLSDLTCAQVAELNQRYASPLQSAAEIEQFYKLVGGHPYLVRRGLQEMKHRKMDLAALESEADHESGPYAGHLERLFVFLSLDAETQDAELTEAVRRALRGEPCPSSHSFYRLRSAGVLIGASAQEATLRCRLYENFLRKRLP